MHLRLARTSLAIRIKKASRVLRRSEQVGGLLPSGILVGRYENRSAVVRDDLNGMVTGRDEADERRQRPARFVGAAGLLDVEGGR